MAEQILINQQAEIKRYEKSLIHRKEKSEYEQLELLVSKIRGDY